MIRELGLELQIVFNKGAVMVLPAGVNKASGLKAALDDLGLSSHNVVAVGDAENDHAFMRASAYAVAVANALPAVKDTADLVTKGARGAGVMELIELVTKKDADAFGTALKHGAVEIGRYPDGRPLLIHPHSRGAMIAGLSGGGKSTIAQSILERIAARAYQTWVIDPEGDYADLRLATVIGDAKAPPRLPEVLKALEEPGRSVVTNMLAISSEDRPAIFASFLAAAVDLRSRTGRPHWMLVDEAHHVLPAERDPSAAELPMALPATVFVTVDPASMARVALERVDDLFVVGAKMAETVQAFCRALSIPTPSLPEDPPQPGQALLWRRTRGKAPQIATIHPTAEKSERHTRKYAEGELGEDKSFYFRGPDKALNLRAQNLTLFMQMADGVDDPTWLYHLKRHDYSRWMSEAIKDEDLAGEVRDAEAIWTPTAPASGCETRSSADTQRRRRVRRRKATKAPRVIVPLPGWVAPQLTQLTEAAPSGPQWVHEIKLDGFRMAARIERGRPQLLTRTGVDWSDKVSGRRRDVGEGSRKNGLSRRRAMRRGDDGLPSFSQTQAASDGERGVGLFTTLSILASIQAFQGLSLSSGCAIE